MICLMATTATNPFVFSRPITDGPTIQREHELNTLLKRFQDGVNTRLLSPRDYGKTSLLHLLCQEVMRDGSGAVIVDLYGASTAVQMAQTIGAAFEGLPSGKLRRTAAALRRRGGGVGLSTPLAGGSAALGAEGGAERLLIDSLSLPFEISRKTGKRMLICFDEFQEVLRVDLDGLIRSVIQHHGSAVTYVFSGSHPGMMRELFSDRKRPFFGQAAPLDLPRFTDEQIVGFISARFDSSGKSADRALDGLLAIVDGHPQRAMLLAHLLWDRTPTGAEADEETLVFAMEDAWPYIQTQFETLWDSCSNTEKLVLTTLASGVQSLRSRQAIEEFGLSDGSGPRRAANRLLAAGILIEHRPAPNNRLLVIDDPFFARWVADGRRWVI